MGNDEEPSDQELARRQRWFDNYCRLLDENSVVLGPAPGHRFPCPCCRHRTLMERGGFEICPVCFWEDDGQDDHDASIVRGGPNRALSLLQARLNFAQFGACDEASKAHVSSPLPHEWPDMDQVPQFLDGMRVVRWSVVDPRHRHTGKTRQIVNGVLQGPAVALAICQEEGSGGFLLFGCDASWQVITDTWHSTLDEALHQAEFEYEGITATWRAG